MSSTGLHSSDITSKSSFWISVDADANVIGFMLAFFKYCRHKLWIFRDYYKHQKTLPLLRFESSLFSKKVCFP